MKKINRIAVMTLALAFGFGLAGSAYSFADDSLGEKTEEVAKDTKRGAKKMARNVKQKGCELVNGKMECAGKKVKNKVKDAGEGLEDAVD